jgi:hypothetical protein
MALVVEDGTSVAGANTYVSLADAREFALDRGVTLPADDPTASALIIKAMDYIESFRSQYQGTKTSSTQSLQWPRNCVEIDGDPFPNDSIPAELIAAECQGVMEIFAGADLQANSGGQMVKVEKVDVIEQQFMTAAEMGSATGMTINFTKINALLEPLFKDGGIFRTVRV